MFRPIVLSEWISNTMWELSFFSRCNVVKQTLYFSKAFSVRKGKYLALYSKMWINKKEKNLPTAAGVLCKDLYRYIQGRINGEAKTTMPDKNVRNLQ